MIDRLFHRLLGLSLALFAPAASSATPLYRAQKIERTPGADSCFPVAINAKGQTIGTSRSSVTFEAAAWFAGSDARLDAARPVERSDDVVVGLDDAARVAFNRPGADANGLEDRASISRPGGRGAMAIDRLGRRYSHASGMSSDGRVVGSLQDSSKASHAYVTGPGGIGTVDLYDAMDGGFSAVAVNKRGQVVGFRQFLVPVASGPNAQGFVPLPVPGSSPSSDDFVERVAINDSGLVAGETQAEIRGIRVGWTIHADGTGYRSLEALPGTSGDQVVPVGLNNAGYVVGTTDAPPSHYLKVTAAFIVRGPDAPLEDLNELVESGDHGYFTFAGDINNAGQILAGSSNGFCYLLNPVPGASSPD